MGQGVAAVQQGFFLAQRGLGGFAGAKKAAGQHMREGVQQGGMGSTLALLQAPALGLLGHGEQG